MPWYTYAMRGAIAQRETAQGMDTLTGTQLGARLIQRRQELGIEQKEAALMCGVTQPTYHRWEHGRAPAEEFLDSIARFLGVTRPEVVLLRSNEDPATFLADQLDQLTGRLGEVARTLRLLRPPTDPPDPS